MQLFVFSCRSAPRKEPAPEVGLYETRAAILSHNAAHLPKEYPFRHPEQQTFLEKGVVIDLFAREFSKGEVIYGEIRREDGSPLPAKPRLGAFGRDIPVSAISGGHRFFLGVSPEYTQDFFNLSVRSSVTNRLEFQVKLKKKEWPVFESSLDLGNFSDTRSASRPGVKEFIELSARKKNAAFAAKDPDRLGAQLRHPRNTHHITSPFWAKRIYAKYYFKNGKKVMLDPVTSIHRGLDLRGQTGAPVYAMAAGRVALADALHYEGNFILLSHGNGIFTGYMHLDSFAVRTNDLVQAGDLIGACGATGAVTGPHLHVFLNIKGVTVDPLGLLHLPVAPLE